MEKRTTSSDLEHRLAESETWHRRLIEIWAQAVWETDADGVVVTDSPSWRAYTGQTLEEWLGYGWLNAIHPEDRAYAERQWREAVAARALLDAEFRLRAPGGGWRWTNVRAAPVEDHAGRIQKWVGMNIDIDARKRAEAALRDSEETYRSLFASIDEGFCIVELVYDAEGRPHDLRYVETNPAFEKQLGFRPQPGQTVRELLPNLESTWLETYADVARSGEGRRFEDLSPKLQRWFDVFVFPLPADDGHRLAAVFADITARKRAEETLRISNERQEFLLALGDAMRAEHSAEGMIETAARLLGEKLNASRVVFGEFDNEHDLVHIRRGWTARGAEAHPTTLRQSDFAGPLLDELRAGLTVRFDDVGEPPYDRPDLKELAAIGVRAGLSVPLIRGGQLVLNLMIHNHAPYHWSDADVALAQETAERTWAAMERARAEELLRQSEERLSLAVDVGEFSTWDWDVETGRVTWNDRHYLIEGYAIGEVTPSYATWLARFHPEDRERCARLIEAARETGAPYINEFRMLHPDGSVHWASARGLFIHDANGRPSRMVGIMQDITDRKSSEIGRSEDQERQAFLLKLSDAARGEVSQQQIEQISLDMLATHLAVDRACIATSDSGKGETVVGTEVQRTALPPLSGIFRHSDFPESARLASEGTLVIDDVGSATRLSGPNRQSFETVSIGSLIGVGLRRGARDMVWTLAVAMTGPRKWRPADVTLMEQAAERILAAIDRADAESALRESEERFRLMAENVQDYAIFMTDQHDRITGWFPGAAAVFGWQEHEIRGQPGSILYTPEDRAAGVPEREIDTARIAGVAPDIRWHLRKDGFRRFIQGQVIALPGAAGDLKGFVKIGQDVTHKHMAEEQLRQSEERFKQFGEASSGVVWIRNAETLQMEYVSPAFESVYGRSLDELFQGDNFLSWAHIIHPDDRERALGEIERVRQGDRRIFEYRIRRADGSTRWLRDTDFPLRAAEGRVVRIGGIGQDITEEKETSERMNAMVRELHHRTRNLIGIIRSIATQTLRSSETAEEFQQEFGERMESLGRVQDLLSRPQDDPITLEHLLRAELEALASGDLTERITLTGPHLPLKNTALQALALGFHELATNARKYGALHQPEGRLDVRWHVEQASADEAQLVIAWKESGLHNAAGANGNKGYGRQLIERALPAALSGSAEFAITDGDVRCVFVVPMSRISATGTS